MKKFPFFSRSQYFLFLRITLGLMMMAHGAARLYANSVGGFGEFLDSKGFIGGVFIAWLITCVDVLGGAAFALGYSKNLLSGWFSFLLFMGILLVHLPNGWFVVGYQSGGMEYNVLLIICFLLLASDET